jgi:hypothetical protein
MPRARDWRGEWGADGSITFQIELENCDDVAEKLMVFNISSQGFELTILEEHMEIGRDEFIN